MCDQNFKVVGIQKIDEPVSAVKKKWYQGKPILSIIILGIILLGCLGCHYVMPKDPTYMDLKNYLVPPCREFLFGTDTMGRDIFSMIWYGGRISLLIGCLAAVFSTIIAIVVGAVSGMAPQWLDLVLMRFTDILLSIPNLLLVIMIQAILGDANVLSIAFVLGLTCWMSIAKVVRIEVRQIRSADYITASKCMGGHFFHILWKHLTPNFISSIMFMVVMNIRGAILAESTLSFMGLGLPLEVISWGSMLALSEKALSAKAWWVLFIPGAFLVVTLLCVTNLGNIIREKQNKSQSNL